VPRALAVVVLAFVAGAAISDAQPSPRRTTNISSLSAYPGFFHGRPITIVARVASNANGQVTASDPGGSIRVIAQGEAPDGLDEIRGDFWDIGRMRPDDPRLSAIDARAEFHLDPEDPWPKPGQVVAIVSASVIAASPPPAPSIRAIVLNPFRYLDQAVTVVGQFEGRNLGGDLPDAPARSRYDFVLRSADAAIWVCNLRPGGKDFELAVDAQIDTGRWLSVSGRVQQGRGLQWIDGEDGTVELAKPPAAEPATSEEAVRVPAGPPPEVVFSVPIDGETDVSSGTTVRIQFTRDIDPTTVKGNMRVSYSGPETASAEPGPIEFTTRYIAPNRELVLTFPRPLSRFRTVRVELLDGILGTDKQPLKPWALTFEVGGS
jgi:hypothetical protein